ncbi:MAG: hypothetical protein OEY79_01805 [Anaplasmataceae bacterium]|nr:hypothetical protein [Anaplasmataceae bacterium]
MSSRIGISPIIIPNDITIDVIENNDHGSKKICIKKDKNQMSFDLPKYIDIDYSSGSGVLKFILDVLHSKNKKSKSMFGTLRSNVNNSVYGLAIGYKVILNITGVGYRAEMLTSDIMVLFYGLSHRVNYLPCLGVNLSVSKNGDILVCGHDKEKVGSTVDDLCKIRNYNIYKGKGIKRSNETFALKEVKKKK